MEYQNPRIGEIVREQTKLSLSEGYPRVLGNQIIPTIDCSPENHPLLLSSTNNVATTGSGTVLGALAGRFYKVYGYSAGFVKDATCDTADGSVQWAVVQGGISRTFVSIPILTLTAERSMHSVIFPYPIVCDNETAITLTSNTFTVGKFRRTITLYYSIENVS